jgi:hypothetical protein
MKKNIAGLFIIVIAAFSVSAQTTGKTVEKIRAYYNEVSEKAKAAETEDDQGEFGDLIMNELVINKRGHQWRAVGQFRVTHKFFYKTWGETMYPETLNLVAVERKVSDRSYTEEYLYNEKGALLFYFQKAENDDQVPPERSVYFKLGRAIRIVEGKKKRGGRLTAADAATVKEILRQSVRVKDLFMRSTKL